MTNTIKVAEGIVPEGWEAVEFRNPTGNIASWIDILGRVVEDARFNASGPRLIIRRKYDLEATKELLRKVYKPGISFMKGSGGAWFCTDKENYITDCGKLWKHGLHVNEKFLCIEWPPGPWEESLFTI